jgi:hypothetical protein
MNRGIRVFFYGLYMDPLLLKEYGVNMRDPVPARVSGYRLRIGRNATLLPEGGAEACGVLCTLDGEELHRLYGSLPQYAPHTLEAVSEEGERLAVRCYLLREAPEADEVNPAYRKRLEGCLQSYGFALPHSV